MAEPLIPPNLQLHNAAAAEALVKKATRNQRGQVRRNQQLKNKHIQDEPHRNEVFEVEEIGEKDPVASSDQHEKENQQERQRRSEDDKLLTSHVDVELPQASQNPNAQEFANERAEAQQANVESQQQPSSQQNNNQENITPPSTQEILEIYDQEEEEHEEPQPEEDWEYEEPHPLPDKGEKIDREI
ncbi:hypothetical protein GF373_12915 [bacterium]|nr:hypothetical protein [bacterium]